MMEGNLLKLEHFATHDGPGIRLVVFLKGCPLRCRWCHTPESQNTEPELLYLQEKCQHCGACGNIFEKTAPPVRQTYVENCPAGALKIAGLRMSAEEIITEAEKERIFFDESGGGLTISGGEPLFQKEFSFSLLRLAAECGIRCCVETSGFGDPNALKSWIPYVEWFLFDCKETDPELHRRFTGVDNRLILSNLNLLDQWGGSIILRCPLIPGVNDRADHLQGIARLAEQLDHVKEIHIEPYHPPATEHYRRLHRKIPSLPKEFPSTVVVETWRRQIAELTVKPVVIP